MSDRQSDRTQHLSPRAFSAFCPVERCLLASLLFFGPSALAVIGFDRVSQFFTCTRPLLHLWAASSARTSERAPLLPGRAHLTRCDLYICPTHGLQHHLDPPRCASNITLFDPQGVYPHMDPYICGTASLGKRCRREASSSELFFDTTSVVNINKHFVSPRRYFFA